MRENPWDCLDLRNIENVLGFEIYRRKWRLFGSGGQSWDVIDCKSAS